MHRDSPGFPLPKINDKASMSGQALLMLEKGPKMLTGHVIDSTPILGNRVFNFNSW
jgi:hypothetical protein